MKPSASDDSSGLDGCANVGGLSLSAEDDSAGENGAFTEACKTHK